MPYRSILAVVVLGSCLSCGSSSGSEEPGSAGGAGASTGGAAGAGGGSGAGAGGPGGTGTGGASGGTTSAGAGGGGGSESSPPTIGACPVFPSGDAWNTDVSAEPADADWTARLHAMVGDIQLHPDYGRDGDELYGIPINVVPEDQPLVDVTFDWWAEESDPGPYPFPGPDTVEIEGNDPASMDGDRHLLVVQEGTCRLYEGYACYHDGEWHCGNGATWDLTEVSYGQRPEGWTSADAAGLAITPGILRYDEVVARDVRHALRFTTACTRPNYVAPATHYAVPGDCDENDPNSPPMGLRVRLRADFDTSSFSEGARAVLTAMQRYGMILADNGSNFYFQGEAHPDWNLDEIEELKTVPVSEFEVVQPGPLEP